MNNGAESQVDLLDGPELPQSLMVDLVHTGSLLFLILVTRMETSTPNLCFYIEVNALPIPITWIVTQDHCLSPVQSVFHPPVTAPLCQFPQEVQLHGHSQNI